ncbi:hypothetical protein OIDMADRAFT_135545 [Oidiodendron maius Zn]|uniref:Uncharacterized protein n=1 Tax=Oidiodendron maius (strain Zn) TaxID=913774 RepID=A0A0C3C7A5_OIDMZ|nr:hypothetical protein OIDMADRAFT_135545 [Oidiodendron maius Zn]
MSQDFDENKLNLAIQALKTDPKLKVYTASKVYKEDYCKLGERLCSISPRCAILANSPKMIDRKEIVLVKHIHDLDIKGFLPTLYIIEDIANHIIATYNREYIRPTIGWKFYIAITVTAWLL